MCKPSGHSLQSVCHELCSAMTKQYTKQTVCRPFGHSSQRLSHELCNAMTRQ